MEVPSTISRITYHTSTGYSEILTRMSMSALSSIPRSVICYIGTGGGRDAKEEIQECFRHFVNYSQIKQEIELAKPTGNLDVVFRKYCRRSHQFRDCVTNFTETLEPCLSPDERGSKQTFIDMLDSLIKFVCFKEGRHIALFIAEGGPECLMSNEEKIQECLNSTFSHYIPQEATDNQNDLPQFRLGQTECGRVSPEGEASSEPASPAKVGRWWHTLIEANKNL
ncbi:Interferon- developmental regulator 1 [Homalodisca vitripennis]|nr:Interferon- developmental regulator 1 [Homalodisca vitripennis]